MTHYDEGTIHAWLDGALPAAEAAAIDAHVATCAACAAAVAEARGMIAGASRVLAALDEVPAQVTPRPVSLPTRRRSVMRWATGIAAVLVAGVVLNVSRDVEVERPAAGGPLGEDMAAPQAAPVVASEPEAPPAPPPPPVAVPMPPAARSPASDQPDRSATVAAGATAGATPAQETPAAPPAAGRIALGALGSPPVTPPVARAEMESAPVAQVQALAGCYDVPTAAGAAFTAPTPRRITADRARLTTPAATAAVVRIRLDTGERLPGYRIVAAGTDSVIGMWLPRAGGDSARVTVLGAGVFTIARTRNLPCPEP